MNFKVMPLLYGLTLTLVSFSSTAEKDICSSFPPCKVCGDKAYSLEFFINFQKQYGTMPTVVDNLTKSIEENHDYYSQAFFDHYGGYFFSRTLSDYREDRVKVLEYLLKKGVHPYQPHSEEMRLIMLPIGFDDREIFDMLVKSGKLTDCIEKLKETYQYALFMKNQYYAEELKKLLDKIKEESDVSAGPEELSNKSRS